MIVETKIRSKSDQSYGESAILSWFLTLAFIFAGLVTFLGIYSISVVAHADNFTDIFYTNSFRGAFEWIQKLDWIGMIVQIVISVFSLVGTALLVIRIMTSMLFLSAKGLWEEVHDLKSGGESDKFDFGLINMAKSWMKGKSGTGLDAIIGAILILLPDVKKYSDFGEKSGGKFDQDINISQYMLKIALPTIMTVFFFAMGFNGTLFKALAVTVDALGTVADRAVSINYAGFVDDLINSGTGYQFVFNAAGTNQGDLQQSVAKDVYGRLVSKIKGANASQLYTLGQNVEVWVSENITPDNIAANGTTQISEQVIDGLGGDSSDQYMGYLGYEILVNGSESANGEICSAPVSEFFTDVSALSDMQGQEQYVHLFVRQTTAFNGSYFNLEATSGESQS